MDNTEACFSTTKTYTGNASMNTIMVVPCYNEAERIDTDAFVEFALKNTGIQFLFVDDGSTDGTLSVLASMLARAPHVLDVLALPNNCGKDEAVRQGMAYAADSGAAFIGYFDADLATPLEAIVDMQRVFVGLPEIEIVFGSRQQGLGHRIKRHPARNVVSSICARLARFATGLRLMDTQCGAKLFRTTSHLRTSLSEPFQAGWLFDVELAVRLAGSRNKIKDHFYELPLMKWREVGGSKVKSTDIFKSGLVMLRLILKRWAIRKEFRRRTDQAKLQAEPRIALNSSFGLQDLAYLRERCLGQAPLVQIDLTNVSSFGPSVFSALIGLCDEMKQNGQMPCIMLPNDDAACHAARRAGLVALYDCRRHMGMPELKQDPLPALKAA